MKGYVESTKQGVQVIHYSPQNGIVTFEGTDENGIPFTESITVKKQNILTRIMRRLKWNT